VAASKGDVHLKRSIPASVSDSKFLVAPTYCDIGGGRRYAKTDQDMLKPARAGMKHIIDIIQFAERRKPAENLDGFTHSFGGQRVCPPS